MNSKVKWLVVLGMTALLLVAFGAVASAAPNAPEALPTGCMTVAPNPNVGLADYDCDGIPDVIEDANGNTVWDPGETDWKSIDTDGDGLCDGPAANSAIVTGYGAKNACAQYARPGDAAHPNRGGEDKNADGTVGAGETDPRLRDTDGDCVPDGWIDGWYIHKLIGIDDAASCKVDTTKNPLDNIKQSWEGEDANLDGAVNPGNIESNPLIVDTEGDGMPDWFEKANSCLNPQVDDASGDYDGDSFKDMWGQQRLTNYDEYMYRTMFESGKSSMDPCSIDTDADGMRDDWEAAYANLPVYPALPAPGTHTARTANGNFCLDNNHNGYGEGVMVPVVDDAAADKDNDAASALTEFMGLDKTAPSMPFTFDKGDDSTSPCDWDSDREGTVNEAVMGDLDGDGVPTVLKYRPWQMSNILGGSNTFKSGDGYMDGFEYWSRWDPVNITKKTCDTALQAPAAQSAEMHPRMIDDAAGWEGRTINTDYDAETLLNLVEYKGEDGKAPLAGPGIVLFPGDLANPNGWEYADPYFRFQPSGDGKDATNPCNVDTDRGGVDDKLEFDTWDFNGWEMDGNWKLDDTFVDHDYDGLPSLLETKTVTDWMDPDTDADGLCDGNLQYVLDDPNNIYPTFPQAIPYPPIPAGITLASPPYQNPVILAIIVTGGGPKYFDLDSANADFRLGDDYICGGGEDLDRDGKVKGDTDNDQTTDIDEDIDHDGVLDANEDVDSDGKLDKAVEAWTETNPRTPDTDRDGLCDGSAMNEFKQPAGINVADVFPPLWPALLPQLNDPMRCGIGTYDPQGRQIAFRPLGEDLNDNAVAAERGVSETDPLDSDTDDDHLYDFTEVVYAGDCVAPKKYDPLKADTDGDNLYDGFFSIGDWVQDWGTGPDPAFPFPYPAPPPVWNRFLRPNYLGFVPWYGFDGFNDKLNDDADVLVVNDPDDDDQPGEDVEGIVYPGGWLGGDGARAVNETNVCEVDTEKDGIWDGTEYASYEAPLYTRVSPSWNTVAALVVDTDIDLAPITAVPAPDFLRPSVDADSDGDMLCDGDIQNAGNVGCRGSDDALTDANGDWIDDDSPNVAVGAAFGLYWLIGEDITDPEGTQGGIVDPTETNPMKWDTDGDRVDDGIEVVWYERFDCGNRIYRSDLAAWDCDGGNPRDALDQDSDSDGLPDGWIDGWVMATASASGPKDGVIQKWEGEDFDFLAGVVMVANPLNNVAKGMIFPMVAAAPAHAFNGRIDGDTNLDRIWQTHPLNPLPGGIGPVQAETWWETDPLNIDTDQDGINDGIEQNSPLAGGCLIAWSGDTDQDGLADGWFDYNGNGTAQVWEGEAFRRDLAAFFADAVITGDDGSGKGGVKYPAMANDGIIDYFEVWQETNPCNPDSDEDGVNDYVEVWGWETGALITRGWKEGTPTGSLLDGPVPTANPDGDGKFNAVDPNADGYNKWPIMGGPLIPSNQYAYAGDGICDAGLTTSAVIDPFAFQNNALAHVIAGQRIMPGPVDFTEGAVNQTYRHVCFLHEITQQGMNPIFNSNQWGEDTNILQFNPNQPHNFVLLSADGLVGWGGYYAGNPVWNAFEAGSRWVPPWPYQRIIDPTTAPLPWNLYFWQSGPVANINPGFARDSYDYPDAIAPLNTTQEFLAVGDWDRDRVIDDNRENAYAVPGFDDIIGGFPPINNYKLMEDWNETDPLNADTDRDGIPDDFEVYSIYQGENTPRAGFCSGEARWLPLTRDADFDMALDGQEDVDHDGRYESGQPLVIDLPWICPTGDTNSPLCHFDFAAGTGTTPYPSPNSSGVETGVCNPDTDGDGIVDGQELAWGGKAAGYDPADSDTDDDGKADTEPGTPLCNLLDYNKNGIVDVQDIGMVASRWMDPAKYDVLYDINPRLVGGVADGIIDIRDVNLIAIHWNETCP